MLGGATPEGFESGEELRGAARNHVSKFARRDAGYFRRRDVADVSLSILAS